MVAVIQKLDVQIVGWCGPSESAALETDSNLFVDVALNIQGVTTHLQDAQEQEAEEEEHTRDRHKYRFL